MHSYGVVTAGLFAFAGYCLWTVFAQLRLLPVFGVAEAGYSRLLVKGSSAAAVDFDLDHLFFSSR